MIDTSKRIHLIDLHRCFTEVLHQLHTILNQQLDIPCTTNIEDEKFITRRDAQSCEIPTKIIYSFSYLPSSIDSGKNSLTDTIQVVGCI